MAKLCFTATKVNDVVAGLVPAKSTPWACNYKRNDVVASSWPAILKINKKLLTKNNV
jgi:hypothetical protein